MLKWVAQQMGIVPLSVQMEQARQFTEKLEKVGNTEKGHIADMVAEYRIAFEKRGIRVSDPIAYVKEKPAIITRFEVFLKDLQNTNETIKTAAIIIWLHTLRAAQVGNKDPNHEYMVIVKSMWKALSEGFSDISGVDDYPMGFRP